MCGKKILIEGGLHRRSHNFIPLKIRNFWKFLGNFRKNVTTRNFDHLNFFGTKTLMVCQSAPPSHLPYRWLCHWLQPIWSFLEQFVLAHLGRAGILVTEKEPPIPDAIFLLVTQREIYSTIICIILLF